MSALALWIIGTCGMFSLLAMPLILGTLATFADFDNNALGWVAGVEYAGLAAGAILTLLAPQQLQARSIRLWLLAIIILQIVSGLTQSFTLLLILRFGQGLAAGRIYACCLELISQSAKPERNMAIFITLQLITLSVISSLYAHFSTLGQWALFGGLAGLALLALVASVWFPATNTKDDVSTPKSPLLWDGFSIGSLLGLGLFMLGFGIYWPFVERMASHSGLSADVIAPTFATGTLFGIGGALAAVALGNRWGRIAPLAIGIGLTTVFLSLFSKPLTINSFQLAITGILVGSNFAMAFLFTTVAGLIRDPRIVAAIPICQSLGAVMGPVVGGSLFASQGPPGLVMATSICFLSSWALLGLLSYQHPKGS